MDELTLISEFISYDETRPKICTPWIKDGKVYATNGHILLSFPTSYIKGFTVENDDGTRVDVVMCMEKSGFEKLDSTLIEKALEGGAPSYGIEPAFIDCGYCFGEGEFETDDECMHCNSKDTKTVVCHECKGSGLSGIPNPRKGKKIYTITQTSIYLPQGKILADWKYVNIVSGAMAYFGGEWVVANRNNLSPIHFKQNENGIDIVLMPMRS